MSPLPLRADFNAQTTRAAARRSKDGPQARRLLALAAIYDGATRTEAARIGGVGVQIVRDWVMKFNALGPDGLFDRKAPGQPSRLRDEHRQALAAVIESGPIPAIHDVVRWRIVDLCQWLYEEFRVTVPSQDIDRMQNIRCPTEFGSGTKAKDFPMISNGIFGNGAPFRTKLRTLMLLKLLYNYRVSG
ncbi:hypothetical protein Nham_2837 [Nitrobacter hamburgensis X14]|uniref:Transposase n=1 Tax=Nitrobacter hamburgensis (strain DSM 10229 / NCIMB 13809 / X14) TaxID=323097 RepID=Q1QJJ0_NITHX|nr:hypothetical protein Nham_2837 [Nitrobacter hamburgensis X14]